MKYSYLKTGKKTIVPALGAMIGGMLSKKTGVDSVLCVTFSTALATAIYDFTKRVILSKFIMMK